MPIVGKQNGYRSHRELCEGFIRGSIGVRPVRETVTGRKTRKASGCPDRAVDNLGVGNKGDMVPLTSCKKPFCVGAHFEKGTVSYVALEVRGRRACVVQDMNISEYSEKSEREKKGK